MTHGLLHDLRTARANPGPFALGGALGGFVPVAAYVLSHHELRAADGSWNLWQPITPVVFACLLFSVRTVLEWGRRSFGDPLKAVCLVVALEGVMVLSITDVLSWVALAQLVLINAIATACTLIAEDTDREAPQPEAALEGNLVRRESAAPRPRAIARPRPA